MKLHYYPETQSLYIELAPGPGVDAQEVAPGMVLDFNGDGQVIGIDMYEVGPQVDLSRLEVIGLPTVTMAAT